MGEMEVFQDTSMLARAAAERFVSLANHAIKHRGRFLVALTGVPVLQDTYRLLTTEKFANKVDWSRVHVFVTDERAKRYDEPDNRYRLVRETLLEKVPVPSQHCHFIIAEAHPEAAASTYEAEIRSVIGHGDRLDLAFLSMGKDGDTASLLPGHPALEETEAHVVGVSALLIHTAKKIASLRPLLNDAGLSKVKIMGGGAPFNMDPHLFGRLGADAMASNANDAAGVVRMLLAKPVRYVDPRTGKYRWRDAITGRFIPAPQTREEVIA